MKWNVASKIAAGFAITLVIFVIVGAVAYRSVLQQSAAAAWVVHTRDVQYQLTQVLANLQEAEIAERGYLITGMDIYLPAFTDGTARAKADQQHLARLLGDNPRQLARAETLAQSIADVLGQLQDTMDVRKTRDFAAAQALVLSGRVKETMDTVRNRIQEMDTEENDLLKTRIETAQNDARDARLTIIFGTLLAIVVAGILGVLIARHISGPLGVLTEVAERVTAGDLNVKVPVDERSDEVGVLSRAFERMARSLQAVAGVAEQIASGDLRASPKPQSSTDVLGHALVRMIENLRKQIGGMVEGATVLGTAANEIVASTAQLATGASQSAVAVSETTTTVEEVRQTAQLTSQKVRAVADNAQKAAQISHSGRKSTEEVVVGMTRIRTQMEAIGESMTRLSEQSQTIGQIITTVEDLAAQSNLLAVNAAIEAAKAGEHGKGFGVVAQEVKSLAEQSRRATERVRNILRDIQKATTAAVMATEQGGKAVEAGARQTEIAGDSFGSLAGSVAEAAQAATQIAASSQQQVVGMEQVAGAMESIKQASAQNVASAKQLETSARNLNELGVRLKQLAQSYVV